MARISDRIKKLSEKSDTYILRLLEVAKKDFKWYMEKNNRISALIAMDYIKDIKGVLNKRGVKYE
jgi:hypothetical protein